MEQEFSAFQRANAELFGACNLARGTPVHIADLEEERDPPIGVIVHAWLNAINVCTVPDEVFAQLRFAGIDCVLMSVSERS